MRIKNTLQILLSMLVFSLLLSCAGSNQELLQEQDAELVKLREDLAKLEGDLKADRNLITQLERAKVELSEKLDTEQLKRIRKQAEIDSLEDLIDAGSLLSNRISIPNSVLFTSGSAELTDRGKQVIDEVGETLSRYPSREILIEGHSDNVPIGKKYLWKYTSNWELSSARALVVLHYLEDEKHINPRRLGAVAFGEQRPMVKNFDRKSRATNRRVEIVVGKLLESATD